MMNWIYSALAGLVCGLCEPTPLSADAHRGLLRYFFGVESDSPLLLLLCHSAVLAVLLIAGRLELRSLHRTAKLLRSSSRRRAVHANLNQEGTLRLLRQTLIPALIGRLLCGYFGFITERLWMLAIALFFSGMLLWIPGLFRTGNRDGRHLSPVDGLCLSLGSMLAALPGFSAVGGIMVLGSLRGLHRSYALRTAWLLLSAGLAAAIGVDLLTLVGSGFRFELTEILCALLGGVSAAAGACLSIYAMQALCRPGRNGTGNFCFYNWGLALLCIVLFLLV